MARPGDGIGGDDLPEQPVERECHAEGEADPQLVQGACRKHRNARGCDADGGPLQAVQPLVQDEAAEEHVGERVQVIAEARRQYVSASDGLYIEEPVGGNEH